MFVWIGNLDMSQLRQLFSAVHGLAQAYFYICSQLASQQAHWSYMASFTGLAGGWACWLECLGSSPCGFFSKLAQASSWWRLKGKEWKQQGLLRPRLGRAVASLSLHFIDQSLSHGQLRFKETRNRLHLLMEKTSKSYCKESCVGVGGSLWPSL